MFQRTRVPYTITSLPLTGYKLSMLLAARKIITESMKLKITWIILRDNSELRNLVHYSDEFPVFSD